MKARVMADSGAPAVSVIMNCHNGAAFLRQAIDSVYAQTFADWEIVFWDNVSTDGSAGIAQCYDDHLRYFRGSTLVPLYEARNSALAECRGRYVAFLDTDDYWLPHKLQQQVSTIAVNTGTGFVYSNVEILGLDGYRTVKYRSLQPGGDIFRMMLEHYRINLCTVLVSKAAADALPRKFDPTFNIAGDADLLLRIAYRTVVQYVPSITAVYREHQHNLTNVRAADAPAEIDRLLAHLAAEIPDFEANYRCEADAFRRRALKASAFVFWKTGQSAKARRLCRGHLADAHMAALYVLSFFRYSTLWQLGRAVQWMIGTARPTPA